MHYSMRIKNFLTIKITRHTCNSVLKQTLISLLQMQGTRTMKITKIHHMLYRIDIRMLHLTFEGWNLRRFVRIPNICLCTTIQYHNKPGFHYK